MKPTKNHIYCPASHKSKILFKTQKKADNFIKFNSEEILEETGIAPVRSYYCVVCGGWHVTSNPSREYGERMDNRDRRTAKHMRTVDETEQLMKDKLNKVLQYQQQFEEHLLHGEVDESHECFKQARRILSLMRSVGAYTAKNRITQILRRAIKVADRMYFLQRAYRSLENLTPEYIEYIKNKAVRTTYEQKLMQDVEMVVEFRKQHVTQSIDLESFYTRIRQAVAVADFDTARAIVGECNSLVGKMLQQGYTEVEIEKLQTAINRHAAMVDALEGAYNSPDNALDDSICTPGELKSWLEIKDNYPVLKELEERKQRLEGLQTPEELRTEQKTCLKLVKKLSGVSSKDLKQLKAEINNVSYAIPFVDQHLKAIMQEQDNRDKHTMLQIVNMIERMHATYAEGNMAACRSNYDGCCYLLSSINSTNEDTQVLEEHIKAWGSIIAVA